MDGICVKLCHRVAGPVWFFDDRPICSFSLRRNIGECFLNGISGVSNNLVCDVIIYKRLQRQPLPSVRRHSNGGTLLNDVFILFYILGALSTLVASYLARARGSNEPELSITRTKDLDQFIRECQTFQMDHGHMIGNGFDNDLIRFRNKFEQLLGNANE